MGKSWFKVAVRKLSYHSHNDTCRLQPDSSLSQHCCELHRHLHHEQYLAKDSAVPFAKFTINVVFDPTEFIESRNYARSSLEPSSTIPEHFYEDSTLYSHSPLHSDLSDSALHSDISSTISGRSSHGLTQHKTSPISILSIKRRNRSQPPSHGRGAGFDFGSYRGPAVDDIAPPALAPPRNVMNDSGTICHDCNSLYCTLVSDPGHFAIRSWLAEASEASEPSEPSSAPGSRPGSPLTHTSSTDSSHEPLVSPLDSPSGSAKAPYRRIFPASRFSFESASSEDDHHDLGPTINFQTF